MTKEEKNILRKYQNNIFFSSYTYIKDGYIFYKIIEGSLEFMMFLNTIDFMKDNLITNIFMEKIQKTERRI